MKALHVVDHLAGATDAFAYHARMSSFFSRFGSIGRLPDELREQMEPEGIIHVAEKVRARQRFSGSVPGRVAGLDVSRHVGLIVFTRERLHALFPSAPRLKQPLIDQRWDAATNGQATVNISSSGLVIDVDVKRVDPRFHGELSVTFAVELSDDVLAQLPAKRLSYAVSPEYVFDLLGVRAR